MSLAGHSLAATSTWSGATDEFWSTAGNWDVAPVSGDDLVFTGVTNSFCENDLDTDVGGSFVVNSITFDAGAGDGFDFFELDGNPIDISGKTITNDSTTQHDIYIPLKSTGAGLTVAGDGDLLLDALEPGGGGHPFVKDGGGTVYVDGTTNSWALTLNAGKVVWSENQLWPSVDLNGGTLEAAADNMIHFNADVRLNNTMGDAEFLLLGNSATRFRILEGAAGSVISNGGTTGTTATLEVRGNGDSREFAGSIEDGADGGRTALHLVDDSEHTLVLSGANTYSGGTTLDGGTTLELSSTGSLAFKAETGGVANPIAGSGLASLDGTIAIDYSEVGTPAVGDTWSFIQSAVSYGPNFAVQGFTETPADSGLWIFNDGSNDFYFSELSGVSSYGVAPETIWNGGGGDGLWSTAGNWNQEPASPAFLVFGGTTGLENENDLTTHFDAETPFVLSGLLFAEGAGAFSITGNPIDFTARTVVNRSSEVQTLNLTIQVDNSVGGVGFDTGDGEIVLNALALRNGFNTPLDKSGSGTLSITGELDGPDTFQANVTEGKLYADVGENLFFHCTIAAGGTLEIGPRAANGCIHNGGNVTNDGTLVLGENTFEDVGDLGGSGVVTNAGGDGTLATIALRNTRAREFSGSIEDGANGGQTSLQIGLSGRTNPEVFTLSGANTYTGDTVIGQPFAQFHLTETGSLRFGIGADGESNRITALAAQDAGSSVTLDGTLIIDLSEADATQGNAWNIIDVGNLNVTYGATFSLVADDGVTQTPFTETSPGSGIWVYNDGTSDFSLSLSSGDVTYGRTPVTFWTGGGGDANWSTEANWDRAPLSGDAFEFDGTAGVSNTNDLATAWDFGTMTPGDFEVTGISFAPGAGSFTLAGNPIGYSGLDLVNKSPNTQTLDLELQVDGSVGGLTVKTEGGDIVLNSLTLGNGPNTELVKQGFETLFVNGPLGGSDAFKAVVSQGTLVANQPSSSTDSIFQDVNVGAGATLQTDGDAANGAIDDMGEVVVDGTLDLAEGVTEDIGSLEGAGVVTNHGTGGTTSTLRVRGLLETTFAGRILDGPSGGATALELGIPGETDNGSLTLTGLLDFSGDAMIQQPEVSLFLDETSALSLWVGANGVNNRVGSTVPQVGGFIDLNGALVLDLSAASTTDGNSWTLVDVGNLDEAFGETFRLVNGGYVPPTTFAVTSGGGVGGDFEDAATYVSGGRTETFGNAITIPAELVNPAPESVYTTSLIQPHSYTFSGLGAGAEYTVRFHSAELWGGTGAGGRTSDLYINGELVYEEHDPFALAGAGNTAAIVELTARADLGGTLFIEVRSHPGSPDGNCRMNGIEIVPVGGPSGSDFTESANTWTMVDGGITWSFSEATGVLSVTGGGAGGAYDTWLTAYPGMTLTGREEDNEGDGRENVLEFYLDGDPTAVDPELDPQGGLNGENFELSFTRNDDAEGDTTAMLEYGSDLAGWTSVAIPASSGTVGGVSFTISENGADADTILAVVPTGGIAEFFARLNVQ